jgi:hypothetical protein
VEMSARVLMPSVLPIMVLPLRMRKLIEDALTVEISARVLIPRVLPIDGATLSNAKVNGGGIECRNIGNSTNEQGTRSNGTTRQD